ncbi:MAG: hypothetical protein JWM28_1869 [Chitinophagaceae bacterium]|nr:hypothetical protein [Chitinophagaceae bacterium]
MLLEGEYSIGDIAYSVGYKHQQHFTAAFKPKYSYLPSSVNQAAKSNLSFNE